MTQSQTQIQEQEAQRRAARVAKFGLTATLTTDEAAPAINRQPQTLRKWACLENGPIRPIRINGRLHWKVSDLEKLLNGESLSAEVQPATTVVVDPAQDSTEGVVAPKRAVRVTPATQLNPAKDRPEQKPERGTKRSRPAEAKPVVTHAEKRRAIERMLSDAYWSKMSNNAIARHIGVSPPTVRKYRSCVSSNLDSEEERGARPKRSRPAKVNKPVAETA